MKLGNVIQAGIAVLLLGVIVACGETAIKEGKEVEKVESTAKETKEAKEAPAKEEAAPSIAKEVVNNESIKATLMRIESGDDPDWGGEYHEIVFEIENKTDLNIVIQARNVSADGKMVDEANVFMSQEITPGKKADATLTLQDFGDGKIDEIKENIEVTLAVFDWDYALEEEHTVKVDLK